MNKTSTSRRVLATLPILCGWAVFPLVASANRAAVEHATKAATQAEKAGPGGPKAELHWSKPGTCRCEAGKQRPGQGMGDKGRMGMPWGMRGGWRMRRMRPGMGMAMGPGLPQCFRVLLNNAEVVRQTLGINKTLLGELRATWTAFLKRRIDRRAQIAKYQLDMRELLSKEPPDEDAVLRLEQKIVRLRGQLATEGLKTNMAILRKLSKEQREALRGVCPGVD